MLLLLLLTTTAVALQRFYKSIFISGLMLLLLWLSCSSCSSSTSPYHPRVMCIHRQMKQIVPLPLQNREREREREFKRRFRWTNNLHYTGCCSRVAPCRLVPTVIPLDAACIGRLFRLFDSMDAILVRFQHASTYTLPPPQMLMLLMLLMMSLNDRYSFPFYFYFLPVPYDKRSDADGGGWKTVANQPVVACFIFTTDTRPIIRKITSNIQSAYFHFLTVFI